MKDYLENEINVGDEVAYIQHYKTSSCFYKSTVLGFTKKMVILGDKYGSFKKSPDKIICIKSVKEK